VDLNHGQKLDHVDASTAVTIQIMYFSMMIPSVGATTTIGSSARRSRQSTQKSTMQLIAVGEERLDL